MRKLIQQDTVIPAVLGGLLIALLCLPFIRLMSPPGLLCRAQMIVLLPITILLLQVSLAWSGECGPIPHPWFATAMHRWTALVLVSVCLSVFSYIVADPFLRRYTPAHLPPSFRHLLVGLPWFVLFQPLFLVAGTYAFALRLSGRPIVGAAAVVVLHQFIPFLQLHDSVPVGILAVLLLFSGLYGLLMAAVYRFYGLPGPVIVTLITQLRHVFRWV